MNKINIQFLLNHLVRSGIETDLQQKIIEIALKINELTEETDAKRYSLLA